MYSQEFINDMKKLFAVCAICNFGAKVGQFGIMGDFNFHFDCPTAQHMSKILDLLKICNLAQSVNLPIHTHGHILDRIIYHPDDKILVSSFVSNELSVHKKINVASKTTVTKIVHDAKLAYFSSKIADCTNC